MAIQASLPKTPASHVRRLRPRTPSDCPAAPPTPPNRKYVQEAAQGEVGQIELFLNSVPLLSPLGREAKLKLVDAFVEEVFPAGSTIITEGAPGDKFYIVKGWALRRARGASLAWLGSAQPGLYSLPPGRQIACHMAWCVHLIEADRPPALVARKARCGTVSALAYIPIAGPTHAAERRP